VSNLYAFGCSNTYGVALSDCWDTNLKKYNNPSNLAWPKLLASKLGLNCINLSVPGASNKEISKTIIDNLFEFKKDDVIIVLWSYLSRWCILKDDGVENLSYWKNSENSNFWVKNLYHQKDRDFDNKIVIEYIYFLLKEKELNFYFLTSDKESFDSINFNKASFLNVSFSNLKSSFPTALDNKHVGEEGHCFFADEIYKEIKKDNL
jgi:hypothetical protein